MPFELRIHFTGLCLFTPDPTPSDNGPPRLHVVLVADGMHHPRLIYDSGYATEGSRDLSGDLKCERLNGFALTIGTPGGPIDLNLPPAILDLHEMFGVGRLPRKYTGPTPGSDVAARVTALAGGVTSTALGARYIVPGGDADKWPRKITTLVQWTIEGLEGKFDAWKLEPLGQTSPTAGPTLFPINDEIDVWIFNSMAIDLPPPGRRKLPRKGDKAEHFGAYYKLFPSGSHPVPELDEHGSHPLPPLIKSGCMKPKEFSGPRQEDQVERAAPSGRDPLTAHTVTCVTVQAPIEQ